MKIIFMGTPAFSVPALEALIVAGHEVCAVYSQPPRPAGRGKKLQKSPVHLCAEKHGLKVLTPERVRSTEDIDTFASHGADIAVVVAYGQILPQAVLDAPKHGCLNIHASLLPRWRGAAPIHRAIMAGDDKTGVAIMQMEAGLDTGPVLLMEEVPITADDTTASLHDTLASLGADLITKALKGVAAGTLEARPQPDSGVTYAHKIDKAEAEINWQQPAHDIDRLVRGLYPFPGAFTLLGGERVKILAGTVVKGDAVHSNAGQLLDNNLLISCGSGAYRIETAQRAGKGAMDRDTFLRGFPVPAGTRVGQ